MLMKRIERRREESCDLKFCLWLFTGHKNLFERELLIHVSTLGANTRSSDCGSNILL